MGVTAEADGGQPRVVTAEMYGDRDPGYGWTSRAVLEAGLCLALQVGTRAAHGADWHTLLAGRSLGSTCEWQFAVCIQQCCSHKREQGYLYNSLYVHQLT